jgi:periplasmic protein TonB
MAVQILNDMPDAAVHRGDANPSLSDWSPRATQTNSDGKRPLFLAVTVGVHLVAVLGVLSFRHAERTEQPPAPMEVAIIDEVRAADEAPPMTAATMVDLTYVLPVPDPLSFETEISSAPTLVTHAVTPPSSQALAPPLVESVDYLRAPSPVYPRESSRRREHGTVVLRVLVDPSGRPAQIQVERSSGYERLDVAARNAVEKALFRPYEVNGVTQAAQVLIPIEFTRRAS